MCSTMKILCVFWIGLATRFFFFVLITCLLLLLVLFVHIQSLHHQPTAASSTDLLLYLPLPNPLLVRQPSPPCSSSCTSLAGTLEAAAATASPERSHGSFGSPAPRPICIVTAPSIESVAMERAQSLANKLQEVDAISPTTTSNSQQVRGGTARVAQLEQHTIVYTIAPKQPPLHCAFCILHRVRLKWHRHFKRRGRDVCTRGCQGCVAPLQCCINLLRGALAASFGG